MDIANREQYRKYVSDLAHAAVSKTLARWHSSTEPVPDLMAIEEHEISAHEVIKEDPWFKKSNNWPAIYDYTYHQPMAKKLFMNSLSMARKLRPHPVLMSTLAYCALLQDVIREIEHELRVLREEGGDLCHILRTTPTIIK